MGSANETDKRWKGRKIDWLTIQDMDSVDYELKPLNQQQVAVLLMLLDYQKWETRWENLSISKGQLQAWIGDIEERLMRNEGGMTIDYEAWKQAQKEALYEALNDVAKQVVSGRVTNIAVGADGTVTDPTEGGGEENLPPDDPQTPYDENLASKAGGVRAVVDGLQKVLSNMFTWYASGTVTAQQAEDRLVNVYNFVQANANVFAQYWYTVYMNSSGAVTLNEPRMEELFFCKGLNLQQFARYIYEEHATAAEIPVLEVYMENFPQVQLDLWFEFGSATALTEYLSYPCVPIDDESFQLDMSTANAPTYLTAGVWKAGHRYLVTISGTYTDSDTPEVIGDGMYFINTNTGVKTFSSISFANGGFNNPIQANVPYKADHIYSFTVDKPANSGGDAIQITRDNGTMNLPNVTGILSITIKDLGEFEL